MHRHTIEETRERKGDQPGGNQPAGHPQRCPEPADIAEDASEEEERGELDEGGGEVEEEEHEPYQLVRFTCRGVGDGGNVPAKAIVGRVDDRGGHGG